MHRRSFIKTGSAAAFVAALPSFTIRASEASAAAIEVIANKELVLKAIDAARSAGATYADVQLRTTRSEAYETGPKVFVDTITAAGVRALINGYWGFAAFDGLPTLDNMARVGAEAAAQARTGAQASAKGKLRNVELASTPVVTNGTWVMPVEIDPFTIEPGEKLDFVMSIADYYAGQAAGIVGTGSGVVLKRYDRTFASSEGTFVTQTSYATSASVSVAVEEHFRTERRVEYRSDVATWSGAGWEYVLKAPFYENAERLVEEARRMRDPKPVNVGRYDVVFDANAMAKILDSSIGPATELDRAFGYRANFAGTSFLNEPLEMLGTFQMGSNMVNVKANRSMKGGAATVKWDDEGVAPSDITLVKDGIFSDFQTTRESSSWIKDYYAKTGRSVTSNGCSGNNDPTTPQQVLQANLVLDPGAGNETFETLVAGTKKGLAVVGGYVTMDQQCLNGSGRSALVYEIVDGKLGNVMDGASYVFRTPDFFKNVVALGGVMSTRTFGFDDSTRNSLGTTFGGLAHSVSAVPAKVKQVAIIDIMRRA